MHTQKYQVVLRAIVTSENNFLSEHQFPDNWEVYDSVFDNGSFTIRLDTIVDIEIEKREDLTQTACDSSPSLGLSLEQNFYTNVTLWVDEKDEDITLVS